MKSPMRGQEVCASAGLRECVEDLITMLYTIYFTVPFITLTILPSFLRVIDHPLPH